MPENNNELQNKLVEEISLLSKEDIPIE